jgi:hypothetical protein
MGVYSRIMTPLSLSGNLGLKNKGNVSVGTIAVGVTLECNYRLVPVLVVGLIYTYYRSPISYIFGVRACAHFNLKFSFNFQHWFLIVLLVLTFDNTFVIITFVCYIIMYM